MSEITQTAPTSRAWQVLYTSLCLSAGHGIALFFIVTRIRWIPSVHDLGDGEAVAFVAWFLLSIPLLGLTILMRGRLNRMSVGKQGLLAMLAAGLTLVAYAGYFLVVARG